MRGAEVQCELQEGSNPHAYHRQRSALSSSSFVRFTVLIACMTKEGTPLLLHALFGDVDFSVKVLITTVKHHSVDEVHRIFSSFLFLDRLTHALLRIWILRFLGVHSKTFVGLFMLRTRTCSGKTSPLALATCIAKSLCPSSLFSWLHLLLNLPLHTSHLSAISS